MAATEPAALLSSPSSLQADPAPDPEAAGTAAATAVNESAKAAPAPASSGAETGVSKAAMASKLLSLSGVFAVHKPKGPTSAELLNRLKEKLLAGTAARWGPGLQVPRKASKPPERKRGPLGASCHLGRLDLG